MAGKKGLKKPVCSDDEKRRIWKQTLTPGVSAALVARRYSMNVPLIFERLKDPGFAPPKNPPAVASAALDGVFPPVEIDAPPTNRPLLRSRVTLRIIRVPSAPHSVWTPPCRTGDAFLLMARRRCHRLWVFEREGSAIEEETITRIAALQGVANGRAARRLNSALPCGRKEREPPWAIWWHGFNVSDGLPPPMRDFSTVAVGRCPSAYCR